MKSRLSSAIRSLRRIIAMSRKEVAHIRRDTQTLLMALVMPVALLLIFGYGVSLDLDRLPIITVDQDRTSLSRDVVQALRHSGDLVVKGEDDSVEHAILELRRTTAVGVVVIPEGFGRSWIRGERTNLQLVVDGADPTTATQVLNKSESVVAATVSLSSTTSPVTQIPRLVADNWTLYNPTNSSALMLVPGLTALVLAIVCVLLTALTVAREWERGSMEQLFTTPVRRGELIIGKLLPYVGLGFMAVLLVLAVGAWVFGVPIHGSLIALTLSSLLFLVGMLAQGLFISVLTKNQMVATQIGTLTSLLPVQILSGFIYPVSNMPRILQGLAQVLPATHFIAILRGILLRDNGFREQAEHLLSLFAFAVVMVCVTALKFRRRLN
jgi:ABC-2 type transport system permease protein